MIGAVQVPLGVAGPLRINGEYANGEFYIPLATTEGALVASAHRGCSVITASGGANVRIFDDKMTRAPVFIAKDVIGAKKLVGWVKENFMRLKEKAEANAITGKGKTVSADVVLNREIIREKLKTTPEKMAEVNYRKNLVGSARAGSLGFNAHAANIAAAIFIACRQDPAHVVEASNAMTLMELTEDGLYCSVTLPSLAVGTVGGGTGIGAQHECLSMLGAAGAGDPPGANSKKLAEIVAAAVLAGEISLIGALAARHLAKAHAELGR
jgi:hydroxymethylglutaryl-CoA reductase (NADPH)